MSSHTWALQALDDQSLAAQTGQDGISMALDYPNSTISFSEVILTDTDGMPDATNGASLIVAPATYSDTQGIRMFKNNSNTAIATAPVLIKMDADSNSNQPVFNANISLPTDLGRMRINPFSIYLTAGSDSIFEPGTRIKDSTGTIRATGVTELLRVNTEGIDVVFKEGDPLSVNVQLGNAPQGHMLKFTGGSILCVGNNASCMATQGEEGKNPIELISKNSSGESSLKLGFTLKASEQDTGFRLAGFYAGFDNDGLIFGKEGSTDKFDFVLNNVVAGEAGAQAPETFNHLKNGSMGNFGLIGASVTNLKVNVKGM
ncbi:hypothetical protein ACF3NA_02100 [Alkanindiges sp. WGS2144]|uniref:hypothetical protein n=1 Tax=Alkanindiges sp. WGS2144 TaxID=3366808 RepID=UPI003751A852